MLKTDDSQFSRRDPAYHLGEGRVLKTYGYALMREFRAYHLGEGRVLKTYGRVEQGAR